MENNASDEIRELLNLQNQMASNLESVKSTFSQSQFFQIYSIVKYFIQLSLQDPDCVRSHSEIMNNLNPILVDLEMSLQSKDVTKFYSQLKSFNNFVLEEGHSKYCENQRFKFLNLINQFLPLVRKQTQDQSLLDLEISGIDVQMAYKSLIEPISNQKRLEILLAVFQGHQRFKELETTLKLQAGHLIYHLNPLKESGFIVQDIRKNYLLTDKGKTILSNLKDMYNTYSNKI